MECGGCLGSRAYTRIQFSRTKILHKARKGGSNPAIAVGYLACFSRTPEMRIQRDAEFFKVVAELQAVAG